MSTLFTCLPSSWLWSKDKHHTKTTVLDHDRLDMHRYIPTRTHACTHAHPIHIHTHSHSPPPQVCIQPVSSLFTLSLLCLCLSVCLFCFCLSLCLSLFLSASLSFCLTLSVSLCLPLSLFVSVSLPPSLCFCLWSLSLFPPPSLSFILNMKNRLSLLHILHWTRFSRTTMDRRVVTDETRKRSILLHTFQAWWDGADDFTHKNLNACALSQRGQLAEQRHHSVTYCHPTAASSPCCPHTDLTRHLPSLPICGYYGVLDTMQFNPPFLKMTDT